MLPLADFDPAEAADVVNLLFRGNIPPLRKRRTTADTVKRRPGVLRQLASVSLTVFF